MLKTVTNTVNVSQIIGVLPVINGGTGVTISTGTGRVVLSDTPSLSGNTTLTTGNLVIGTSGKGIDFSATPGTGTSELLADYEEGTWTPTQGSELVVVGAFSSGGLYTKIGRVVNFTGFVRGATSVSLPAVGQLTGNLPFSTGNTFFGVAAAMNAASSSGSLLSISITSLYNSTTIAATPTIYFSGSYPV